MERGEGRAAVASRGAKGRERRPKERERTIMTVALPERGKEKVKEPKTKPPKEPLGKGYVRTTKKTFF